MSRWRISVVLPDPISPVMTAKPACPLRAYSIMLKAKRCLRLMKRKAGSGFSAWLTYVELFELNAICQLCVTSAVIMTALAVVTSLRFVAPRPAESARRRG